MFKKLSLLFAIVLVLSASCVYADSSAPVVQMTNGQRAVLDQPNVDIVDDLNTNADMLASLRVIFPDIVFTQNQQMIDNIINGKSSSLLDFKTSEDLSFLYGVRYNLLPYQLKAYNREFANLDIPNPYLSNTITTLQKKPSQGLVNLLQILQGDYNETYGDISKYM